MPQSLSSANLHFVFSTKDRCPFLADGTVRLDTHAYIAQISNRLSCPAITIGGTADHIHALVRLGREVSQSEWVREVKRGSSLWLKSQAENLSDFSWQAGYGAFSVSSNDLRRVSAYIEDQEAHHRVVTFKDEYLRLLEEHSLTWDGRYIWD